MKRTISLLFILSLVSASSFAAGKRRALTASNTVKASKTKSKIGLGDLTVKGDFETISTVVQEVNPAPVNPNASKVDSCWSQESNCI